jgi:hypothetical protein
MSSSLVARLSNWHLHLSRHSTLLKLSFKHFSTQPNPPLDLDPDLRVLLKDVDVSLKRSKTRSQSPRQELEAYPIKDLEQNSLTPDEELSEYAQRKSPAAHFGSQQIGAVVLPPQLQTSINLLISGAKYLP